MSVSSVHLSSDSLIRPMEIPATGLLIAIPSLVAYNYFNEKAEFIMTDLERESLRVLLGDGVAGRHRGG